MLLHHERKCNQIHIDFLEPSVYHIMASSAFHASGGTTSKGLLCTQAFVLESDATNTILGKFRRSLTPIATAPWGIKLAKSIHNLQ